ncbi:hypothetical protein M2336_000744 [Sphingobium sp. B1D7B]|uniref:hypothetical protein n=1 Tax=unclassified Sphingobium TaxID=2611147 RepID=UPI00222413FC|nr:MULTISPECIES: hypothetical protein [unclassified Sphingobium]MCW2392420.1 hypothetical protein [Sphingobium sp. B11D3A]MCW2404115.1 hypothetical protein [Sphingobium sp. B1D7B]
MKKSTASTHLTDDGKKINMFAYIDETGNTGARLLDEAQPLFMTAALLTRSDFDVRFANDIRAIAQVYGADEIHAAVLGIGRLESIAKDLLKVIRKAGPAFAIARVEKSYVVATKVFDTLFDSFENKAVPWHAYNMPALRMPLVFKIAYILDDRAAVAFIDALMEKNDQRAWSKMADFCRLILPRIVDIPDARSREIVTNALEWAAANPEALQFVHSDKVGRKSHLPNIIGFGNLLGAIEKQSGIWEQHRDGSSATGAPYRSLWGRVKLCFNAAAPEARPCGALCRPIAWPRPPSRRSGR